MPGQCACACLGNVRAHVEVEVEVDGDVDVDVDVNVDVDVMWTWVWMWMWMWKWMWVWMWMWTWMWMWMWIPGRFCRDAGSRLRVLADTWISRSCEQPGANIRCVWAKLPKRTQAVGRAGWRIRARATV